MGFYDQLFEQKENTNHGHSQTMQGIAIGRVVENWDDKHPGMVKVEIALSEKGQNRTDWVRVMQPYAGAGYGFYFLPEVGDEVVVGFHLGERDSPVVLGSLWSKVNPTPESIPHKENYNKQLLTKGKNRLLLSDEADKQAITLQSAGGLMLEMADEPVTITLCDKDKKNILTIKSKDGLVSLSAEKRVSVEVGGGSLVLDGQSKTATLKMDNIKIEAGQQLSLKGQSVQIEGAMTKVKASGNMEATAGGILTLKGSITKIN